jgi:hypothetical protein
MKRFNHPIMKEASMTPRTGAQLKRQHGSVSIHIDYSAFEAEMNTYGLRLASMDEIPPAVAIAEALVGEAMVPASAVQEVHTLTGCSAWVSGCPVDGVLLLVPLSDTGLAAVRSGLFDPGGGVVEYYCVRGERCFGVYIGVYAGRTREARGSLMRGSAAARVSIFGEVACFARAATEDGARSMASLGFAPAGFGARDLWVQEAVSAPGRKVA